MLARNLSIKVHFLQSHLAEFPKNIGAVSDEQGERFHQDMNVMQECHQVQFLWFWIKMRVSFTIKIKRDREKLMSYLNSDAES
ncbi:hypothetical protein J437_LFUL013109 [Ladona fulva]|uniref:Uncharacterized protein n=1 Tax=Ladona fulva TaxID=123851 RepID=A0A8K0KD03_LADFU|nr:hypothetical protein J437_LFUL013109 [Ladona fulva]